MAKVKEETPQDLPKIDIPKIKAKDLNPRFHEFLSWLKEIFPYGTDLDAMCIFKTETRQSAEALHVSVFTEKHSYFISVIPPSQPYAEGYLGATCSNRFQEPGEDWLRGSDLPDGKYSHETWEQIMRRIIATELIRVETN